MLAPAFAAMQLQNTDYQNALTIESQMMAETQKQQMQRWEIAQDTQTKIFQIMQDVTSNKATTQDKAYRKWDEYIRN
jgi:hypothetical protein